MFILKVLLKRLDVIYTLPMVQQQSCAKTKLLGLSEFDRLCLIDILSVSLSVLRVRESVFICQ